MPIHQNRFSPQALEDGDRMLSARPFAARAENAPTLSPRLGHHLGQYALGDSSGGGYADAGLPGMGYAAVDPPAAAPPSVGYADADAAIRPRVLMGARRNAVDRSGDGPKARRRFADTPAVEASGVTQYADPDAEIQQAGSVTQYADPDAEIQQARGSQNPLSGYVSELSADSVIRAAPMPVASSPGLTPIAPGAQYKDEDKKYGWRADLTPANRALLDPTSPTHDPARHQQIADQTDLRVTQYLSEDERQKHALTVNKHGLLKDADGAKKDTRYGNGGGFNPTEGTEIFVMGMDGSLNVANAARENRFGDRSAGTPDEMMHHTSFYAGGAVAGAGELKVDRGRLREVSDQSGHYKPTAEITHQSVAHMAKSREEGGLGISMVDDTPDASGHAINKPVDVRLGGKPGLGDDSITLTHQQFLQTGGNEKQIRAKRGLNAEIAARGAGGEPTQHANAAADSQSDNPYDSIPAVPHALSSGYGIPIPAESVYDGIPTDTNGYGVPIPAMSGYDGIPSGLSGYDGIPNPAANAVVGGYDTLPSGLGIPSGYDGIPPHSNGYGVERPVG